MSSYLFIDVETSGFGDNAAVVEIAAIPYIDGEYLPHYQSYVAPHIGATMDAKAFEVNGINVNSLKDYPIKDTVYSFIKWIDTHEKVFTIVAHNAKFDKEKLYQLFCRTANYGDFVTKFRFNHVCTMELAKELFKNKKKKPEGFSLAKLCKFFGISLINAHSALPDIEATVQLYEELKKMKAKDLPIAKELTYLEKRRKYMAMDYLTINPEGDIYINCKATKDSDAMSFILSEIYDITVSDL